MIFRVALPARSCAATHASDSAIRVRNRLPERPGGCYAQKVPVPFSDSPLARFGRGAGGEGDPSVGFILFGDGPLREPLSRQIAARGLTGKFILAGFHSDLDRFFPHLDLLVQSSFTEGLPNVVLEAYAAGVPVVATAVGGTPEIIEDGVSGYLVESGNPAALAGGIVKMLSNDAQRRAMGLHGQKVVKDRFSFASQAREYERLFDSLLSTNGKAKS